ncbi:MAG: HAMP domain-containing sensor histidine kinase [Acidobacteria bacterium]|nr:HAMP domain-containing sensor histidine kinase [Acidobacteriota bacterium]
MSISIRTQILASAFVLFLPVVWLIWIASSATYTEQREYLSDDARILATMLAHQLDQQGEGTADALVTSALDALPPLSTVTVTDADGRVLAGQPPLHPELFRSGSTVPGPDRRMVTVYLREALAWDRTWRIYRRNYAVVGGVTFTVVVIVFLLSRRWRRGLRDLELQARRVGTGDRTDQPPPKMPSSEMVSLQTSFSEMERNLASLERQVVRQERLAAIGTLASGLAHELNNPLQAIAGLAELLLREGALPDTVRADLDLMQKESARASVIIRNLSRFGRQAQVSAEPTRLTDVVNAVVELRRHRLNELGIHLVVDDASREMFRGVLPEFQQVVLNFVVNAEQAMAAMTRGQRVLTIRTRDVEGRVYCEVEDTGPGVPTDEEARLFQPFFTTKPVGEGTGLGLSVSYGIIESYGGRIEYRASDSGGAMFWFDVPAVTA